MKINFNLAFILRQTVLAVNIRVENNMSAYLRIAGLILQAIILIIALN